MYRPDDEKYYPGVVTFICTRSGRSLVQYEDGETEILDLSEEKFRIISTESSDAESVGDEPTTTEHDDGVVDQIRGHIAWISMYQPEALHLWQIHYRAHYGSYYTD